MALALTIEDGSIVANADSYVAVGDFVTFAAKRGVTVPADDTACIALYAAMDLISGFADRFVGERVSNVQALDWPRCRYVDDSVRNGRYLPINMTPIVPPAKYVMPDALIRAQCFAALAAFNGNELQPVVGVEGFVTSEKIGPIQTDYSQPVGFRNQPTIPAFDLAINSICRRTGFLTNYRG